MIERAQGTRDRLVIRQAASLLATDLSLGELFERLTRLLAKYIDSSVVFIALAHPDERSAIEFIYDHGEIRRYPSIVLSETSRALEVIRTGQIIWGNSPGVWAPSGTTPINRDRPWTNDSISAVFVPMMAGGATVGALSVQSPRADAYTPLDVETIAAIGHYVGVAVQNQRMYQELQRTAECDPLTLLANNARMTREIDRALAEATSISTIAAIRLDIVNFSAFNETYGYDEGDSVLREIAGMLVSFEDADEKITVGRFSGDVFMLLLRDTSSQSVGQFVMHLTSKLKELFYVAGDQTLPIPIACGYVVAPLDAGTRGEIIARCQLRTRLSRRLGCRPVGDDEVDSYTVHGTFTGLETIVEALLDSDPFARMHLLHVNTMAKLWSEYNLELGYGDLTMFLQASLLHDVGKLLVPGKILMKPGPLSEQDYAAVMEHPTFGRNILAQEDGFDEVAQIVWMHHERWDGAGYPNKLAGEQIHPLARAVAILDAYSAMVADRPYHRGISEDAALAELQRCAGTQFDPALVERFVAWREEGNPPRLR